MALGNSYPAQLLQTNGQPLDGIDAIQFTDDTDQPGSGGSGATGVNAALRVDSTVSTNTGAGFIGMQTGGLIVSTVGWSLAAAMGVVASLADVRYDLQGLVPSTSDALDISVLVSVTDASGTNIAGASGGFTVPSPVTDLASTHTLTGGTWGVTAGTDLTVSGDVLSSTAGGNFFVLVQVTVSWD